MKIKLYFFGKKNEITPREEELIKRIGFRSSLEIIPLAQAGVTDVTKAKKKEAELLLNKICVQDFVIAFDEHGKELDSIQFSSQLKNWLVERGEVVFVIGGAHGLDESILTRANVKLRFGQMVWTRNLFRLMALEQLYRALEIDGGGHFHKD
jgi:23S rRNA (pseudouridine1915-N3)-methyltransferase